MTRGARVSSGIGASILRTRSRIVAAGEVADAPGASVRGNGLDLAERDGQAAYQLVTADALGLAPPVTGNHGLIDAKPDR